MLLTFCAFSVKCFGRSGGDSLHLVIVEQAFHTTTQCYCFTPAQIISSCAHTRAHTHTNIHIHKHTHLQHHTCKFKAARSKKDRRDIPLDTLITSWTFPFHYLLHPCLEALASSPPYALWTLPFINLASSRLDVSGYFSCVFHFEL